LRRGRITARELGQLCGKSERAIRSYETGERNPKPETAFKIGEAIGLSKAQVIEVFYSGAEAVAKGA
jgi:transcriptional regulator with XRE-family HTH domain